MLKSLADSSAKPKMLFRSLSADIKLRSIYRKHLVRNSDQLLPHTIAEMHTACTLLMKQIFNLAKTISLQCRTRSIKLVTGGKRRRSSAQEATHTAFYFAAQGEISARSFCADARGYSCRPATIASGVRVGLEDVLIVAKRHQCPPTGVGWMLNERTETGIWLNTAFEQQSFGFIQFQNWLGVVHQPYKWRRNCVSLPGWRRRTMFAGATGSG